MTSFGGISTNPKAQERQVAEAEVEGVTLALTVLVSALQALAKVVIVPRVIRSLEVLV